MASEASQKKRQEAKLYEVIPKDKIPKAEYDLDADISFMSSHDIPIPDSIEYIPKDPSNIRSDVVKMETECVDGFETYFGKLNNLYRKSDCTKYWKNDNYFDSIVAEAKKYADKYSCICKGAKKDNKLFPCFFESVGGSKTYTKQQITRSQNILMSNSKVYMQLQKDIYNDTYHIVDKVTKDLEDGFYDLKFQEGEYDRSVEYPKYNIEDEPQMYRAAIIYQKAVNSILIMQSNIIDDMYVPINNYISDAIDISVKTINAFNSEVNKFNND